MANESAMADSVCYPKATFQALADGGSLWGVLGVRNPSQT
jgi:hypothetical protein